MEPNTAVLIAVIMLAALLAARVPVAFALIASGVTGVWLLQGSSIAASVLARLPYETPSRYVLVIVPMFIAMGVFAKHGTIATDGFAIAARLLRRVPGGLAVATVFASAGFASVSGSSVATVAALGPISVREMRTHGYDKTMSIGVIAVAGTLGVLIPPSVALVLMGIVTGESIGLLLIAGIVPGIVSALAYVVLIVVRALRRPDRMGVGFEAPVETEVGQGRRRLWSLGKIGVLFTIVVGSIYFGVASTTEAAAIGAFITLVFFVGETLRQKSVGTRPDRTRTRAGLLGGAVGEATRLTGMAFALLIGGSVLTYLLVAARVPSNLATFVAEIAAPELVIIAILLLAFVPLGMFLDPLSIILVAVPIAHPVATSVGADGIWFSILVVKMIEIGLITPPFGINAYVVAGVAKDVSVTDAFRAVLWFLPADILTIILLFTFPELVTWLPSMAGV